jgi:hypothetical protein
LTALTLAMSKGTDRHIEDEARGPVHTRPKYVPFSARQDFGQ